MVLIQFTQQECQTIQQVDTPQGGNTAMKGRWWSQVIQLPFGGEMPPIRLAGCRETQAWTYAKTIQIDVLIIILLYRQTVQQGSNPYRATTFLMIRRVTTCESNSSVRLRRPTLSMMLSSSGIRFHTRVRYVSAGLNNLKSELSISVNCYTSVNVDLSMSLNCSICLYTQYW